MDIGAKLGKSINWDSSGQISSGENSLSSCFLRVNISDCTNPKKSAITVVAKKMKNYSQTKKERNLVR